MLPYGRSVHKRHGNPPIRYNESPILQRKYRMDWNQIGLIAMAVAVIFIAFVYLLIRL